MWLTNYWPMLNWHPANLETKLYYTVRMLYWVNYSVFWNEYFFSMFREIVEKRETFDLSIKDVNTEVSFYFLFTYFWVSIKVIWYIDISQVAGSCANVILVGHMYTILRDLNKRTWPFLHTRNDKSQCSELNVAITWCICKLHMHLTPDSMWRLQITDTINIINE